MTEPFFRTIPAVAFDTDDHIADGVWPAWASPPWHRSPGSLLIDREVGRSDTTVVIVDTARVYDEGVVLRLVVRIRETGRFARRRVWEYLDLAHGRGNLDARFASDGLRWGVRFADGRSMTSQDESPWASAGDIDEVQVGGPVIEGTGRPSVYADTWSREYWIWPLPPLPSLEIGVEWPARGIAETVTVIETAPILAAATQCRPLWPEREA